MLQQYKKDVKMLRRLHEYIVSGRSGSRQELSQKLGISLSQLANYLQHIRESGINLQYDRYYCRYYYQNQIVRYASGFTFWPVNFGNKYQKTDAGVGAAKKIHILQTNYVMEENKLYAKMDVYELLDRFIEADDWNNRTEISSVVKTKVGHLLTKLIIEQRRTINLLEENAVLIAKNGLQGEN